MNVLSWLLAQSRVSCSLWTRITLLLGFVVALGHLISDLSVNAAESENLKYIVNSPQKDSEVESIISPPTPPQNTVDSAEVPSSDETLDVPEGASRRSEQDKASSPAQSEIERRFRSFRVDPSTLPKSPPDITHATVNVDQEGTTPLSPPDPMFVPHTHHQRGRLLIRTLRNVSADIRTRQRFYSAASPLKYHRRVPNPDAIAWNQHVQPKIRPTGRPANGVVFISSVFGVRPNPFGRGTEFHTGIDLVGAKGIPILATAAGKVVARRRGRGLGIHVIVDHGSGYETLYAHLSRKRVRNNQRVKRGQIIGFLGSTGRSTGPHLHYAVYRNRKAVDPKPYLFK